VYAPDAFTTALFQQMMANSATGEFSGSSYRPFIEAYNASHGVYRGVGNQVAAGSTIRFFDAEKLETWLAQNSLGYLGFDLGPKGGANLGPGKKPGYTIFVLNTWDSPQAQAILAPQHEYHTLRSTGSTPTRTPSQGSIGGACGEATTGRSSSTSELRRIRTSRRRGATAAAIRSARMRSTRRSGSTRTALPG
jgi:hypothetical protein